MVTLRDFPTIELVERMSKGEGIKPIVAEFDLVVSEIGCTNGTSEEVVTCVILALLRVGIGTATFEKITS